MKKITIFSLILLGFVFYPSLIKADVILPGTHNVDRCVKINSWDYSKVLLLGVVTGPMKDGNYNFNIKENECISIGYKFNRLDVYLVDPLSSSNIPDPDNLIYKNLEVYGGAVEDKNPLIKETIEYTLVPVGSSYNLEKTKIISEYNNGKPSDVKILSNPNKKEQVKENVKKEINPISDKEVEKDNNTNLGDNQMSDFQKNIIKKSLWLKIKCFFGFNKNC